MQSSMAIYYFLFKIQLITNGFVGPKGFRGFQQLGQWTFNLEVQFCLGLTQDALESNLTFISLLRQIYMVRFLLTIVACDFCKRVLLASWKNRIRFPRYQIACCYDCRRVLKHVSKAHDIFRVVHDNRKHVVGLIYTKRFMS